MGRHSKAHLKYRDTTARETVANDREKCALKWQSIKQMRLKMEEKSYSEAVSVASSTITEIQKEHIRACILKAIENGAYHPGLEERACQAISYINQFSDAQIKENLIDNKTGEVYMLVRP